MVSKHLYMQSIHSGRIGSSIAAGISHSVVCTKNTIDRVHLRRQQGRAGQGKRALPGQQLVVTGA